MEFNSNDIYLGDEPDSRSVGGERTGGDLTNKPIYLLEHLATFTVNKETGIVNPSDGMRRLLQLEKTTGIWSQKMQLCLDNHWILIMDYETGNVIERFSASLIQDPTAFTSNSPMEIYNNILVFIVAGGSGSRPEMHIFQSQSISAIHLVEDLKELRNGKIVTQMREYLPVSSSKSFSNHMRNEIDNMLRENVNSNIGGGVVFNNETESDIGILNDETSSTSSDKYERDVMVLNHCFDDIEKFIARLQHAAAASRELERRRRNRKSKKKDPGEGLLTLRTRLPNEKEFIDIFGKFKLSLNLLAKLKAHIHDPNAPELVHFLFTPLALIVEASSDTYYESHLPAHVINPLLTNDAINLLNNCVTSKETELWRSLGDAWTIPRNQWKGHVGSYHPVFFDGWSPDYSVVDDLEQPSTPNITSKHQHIDSHFIAKNFIGQNTMQHQHRLVESPTERIENKNDDDFDRNAAGHQYHHHHYLHEGIPNAHNERSGFRDFSSRSDLSTDSIEKNANQQGLTTIKGNTVNNNANLSTAGAIYSLASGIQNMSTNIRNQMNISPANDGFQNLDIEQWLEKLQSRGSKVVQVTYPRTANNDKELTVIRGEILEVLDDSRKWWKVRNIRGQAAHVPHTIITTYSFDKNNEIFNIAVNNQNHNKKKHSESHEAALLQSQISAEWIRNKHIENQFDNESENFENNYKISSEGSNITKPPPPPPPPSNESLVNQVSSNKNENLVKTDNSKYHTISNNSPNLGIQKELKDVLTLFRDKRRNLEIIKTPEIFIQQNSSVTEVENWLRAKGFSSPLIDSLKGLNGNELFALKRHHIEILCGLEEGKRLASQITVQRNVSGYKTARTSELQAILALAREKSENPKKYTETN